MEKDHRLASAARSRGIVVEPRPSNVYELTAHSERVRAAQPDALETVRLPEGRMLAGVGGAALWRSHHATHSTILPAIADAATVYGDAR